MNPACRDFLSAMLQTAPERPPAESALGGHLAGCESCRLSFARMCRTRQALEQLSRARAPAALDGLVVAATQAGQRQERALAHLRTALRHEAPARLDACVGVAGASILGDVTRVAAPAVLERLVEEELRDPQHALTRRYVARLKHLGAPASLRQRVHQILGTPRRSVGRRLLLGGAAFAVLFATLWGWWGLERANIRPRFQVVHLKDAGELDPLARDMLFGVTGGWSELAGKPR